MSDVEYLKQWRKDNVSAVQEYRKVHADEIQLYQKEISKTPKRRHNALKSILKREGVSFTDPLWRFNFYFELIRDFQCHYCGGLLNPTSHALDRRDNSFAHVSFNVVPCCWSCNQRKKSDLSYEEMMILSPALRKIRLLREEFSKEKIVE